MLWSFVLVPCLTSGASCNDLEYIVAYLKFPFSLLMECFEVSFGFLFVGTMASVMWLSTLMITSLFHRVNGIALIDLPGESSRYCSLSGKLSI